MYRSSLTSSGPAYTFRVYCTVKPDAPADWTVLVVPIGSAEFRTVIVRGATYEYGSPVVVSTRRPSFLE